MSDSAESGFTLTEMAVALMVLAIVMTMTYAIATTLLKQTASGTATGVSAEAAQSQMVVLEQYLNGAITPANADTETGLSSLCSGTGISSTQAVQTAYDYALELCTAPFDRNSCTSSNQSSLNTSCPQLYLLYVDKTTCTTSGQCTLKILDLSTSTPSAVSTWGLFRCSTACQSDLETVSSSGVVTPPVNEGLGHLGNGTTPSFPYLFTFYDSTGTHQVDGSTPSAIQSIHFDAEALNVPASPIFSAQKYTEITDGVWLTGAATPSA
jgi:prepilin-type N-terminal cleavage/methylation domain-containing protein